jgi:hypothetical protein
MREDIHCVGLYGLSIQLNLKLKMVKMITTIVNSSYTTCNKRTPFLDYDERVSYLCCALLLKTSSLQGQFDVHFKASSFFVMLKRAGKGDNSAPFSKEFQYR